MSTPKPIKLTVAQLRKAASQHLKTMVPHLVDCMVERRPDPKPDVLVIEYETGGKHKQCEIPLNADGSITVPEPKAKDKAAAK